MKKLAEYFTESEQGHIRPQVGDIFDIVINEELAIEADVLESTEDKLVLEYDERGISLLEGLDLIEEEDTVTEGKVKDLLLDIEELTDKEFQDKYNMSKLDAKEKFDLDEMRKPNVITLAGRAHDAFKELKDYEAEEVDFHKAIDDLVHRTFGHRSKEKKMEADLSEASNNITKIKDIVSKQQAMKIDGIMVDMFTASAISQIYNKVNDTNKKKMEDLDITKLAELAMKMMESKQSYDNVVEDGDELDEAEYQGREVNLGKPMRGDVAKYKVYVKDKKTGNVKKVNFGDKNMEIKRDDPKRRKSFRARHGCGTPKASDRTKARYWSCRMWSTTPVSKII